MRDAYDKTITGLVLVSSVMTFALLAYAAYDENFGGDWYGYQSSYKEQLSADAAERFSVSQKQLYLTELGRIDRCVTCHVSIEDPAMENAPQPLTTHPGDIMANHPKEQFGCTVCHLGQGRATTEADAHGHVPHWTYPMLPTEELDRACPKCHTEPSLPGLPRYDRAMSLFGAKACISCHKLRGQGGDAGPDLTSIGDPHGADFHDEEWHSQHFKDPKSLVATSEMPDFDLTDEEAEALVYLMMSFTGEAIPTELLSNPKPPPLEEPEIDPLAAKGHVGSAICIGCHQGLHPEAVEGWHQSKMSTTFERIKDEPVKDNCLPCHTTGFNPVTGHYSEPSVGCEGCHGPGREAYELIMAGKVEEHKRAIRLDPEASLVCARCHNPHVPVGVHAELYRLQPPRFSHEGE